MTFGSLFAGIGGFDLGFERSGLKCAWQVEKDSTCQKVLSRHWSNVEKFSDVRECGKHNLAKVDVLCGGFPCQDLSVAGRRQGITGERSGLWFEFIRIIDELKPRFACIENVPGLLSSNGGKDFAVILRGLVECGYGVAWRIFDSQYDGVAQRRRRVFIVGSLGNGSASEILFESESVSWDTPTRRKAGQDVAFALAASVRGSGDGHGNGWNSNYVARALNAHGRRLDGDSETFVAKTLTANYGKQIDSSDTNGGPPNLICNTFSGADDNDAQGNHLIAFGLLGETTPKVSENIMPTLRSAGKNSGEQHQFVGTKSGVRRLSPRECERLQAFPDDHTRYDADGNEIVDSARYRMLGNAICVNTAEWIGKRINANS